MKTPTNKYAVAYAGTTIYADTPEEALAISDGIAEKNGNLLPFSDQSGENKTYEITVHSDGSLRCPDYRLAATAQMRKTGHWPCRFCGRRVTPWGGRVSATPFVQSHLSGPMAYRERDLVIPRMAYHQLVRAGCHVDVGEVAEIPIPAKGSNSIPPAGSPIWDRVMERLGEIEKRSDIEGRLAAIEARLGLVEAIPAVELPGDFAERWKILGELIADHAAVEELRQMAKRAAESQVAPATPASQPKAKPKAEPKTPTKEVKSSVAPRDRLGQIRRSAEALPSKQVAPTTAPASEKKHTFVRDQRLRDTSGQPPSERATKFKQSRTDLGIPAHVMAEVAGFMLAEYQALESGDLSPIDSSEKSFWADMRAGLERANRQWNQKELPNLPKGEPAAKNPVRRGTPMF